MTIKEQFQRANQIDPNASVEKLAVKKYVMKIGDGVIHRLSGTIGRVVGIEQTSDTGNGALLTVQLVSGRVLRNLKREEFDLESRVPVIMAAMISVPAVAPITMPKLDGEISTASILEELS